MKGRLAACGVLGFILLACSGSDGHDGANGGQGDKGDQGKSALLETNAEPAGANCATGGTRVRSGLDANGDGKLQDGEVTSTVYICNGTSGKDGKDGTNGINGVNGKDGASGSNTLMLLADEPAGTNCTAGGKKIQTGVDDDNDGVLDSDEVDQTVYVCNGIDGANGLNTLVAVTSESAGDNCPDGGKKIQTGVDDNGNGTLDEEEIDQTTFVCNGADGSNGTNGLNAAVRVTDEPAGANCNFGGKKIESGLDDDGNGALDASEVDQTSYLCAAEWCDGKLYKDSCWFLADDGVSCTTYCSTRGNVDPATMTLIGSNGTLAECAAVLGLLGVTGPVDDGFASGGPVPGIGCASTTDHAFGLRLADVTTTADAGWRTALRACACGSAPTGDR